MENPMTQTVASTLFQYVFELSICFISYEVVPETTLKHCYEKAEVVLSTMHLKEVESFSSMDTFTAELISVSKDMIQQIRQTRQLDRKYLLLLKLFKEEIFLKDLATWLVLGQQGNGDQVRRSLEKHMLPMLSSTHPILRHEFSEIFFKSIERHLVQNSSLATWRREALKKVLGSS